MTWFYLGTGPANDPTILNRLLGFRGPIGCDVETISLTDRTPLGAGFAIGPNDKFYFTIDDARFPWRLLHDPAQEIIFHNSGFDVRILEDYSGQPISNITDSCIIALLLGLPGKLANLCEELFGRPPRLISDLIGTGTNTIGMDQVPIDKVAERACEDAWDALEAYFEISKRYTIPQRALDLETRFLPVALNMERLGIRIDKDAVHEHRLRLERQLTYFRDICEGAFGFNPGSSPQLAIALEARGYRVPYKISSDGKRRPRLDKNILDTYYAVEPIAVMARTYRSTQTLLTHLIKPLDEGRYLTEDRIYPRVNLNVASTGRISRSVPPTQNISSVLRNIVIPSEGNIILDWDFSQIELREAAWLWEDTAMQSIFKSGKDVHTATADKLILAGLGHILGSDPSKRRRLAKDLNFAMLFGGTSETLYNRKRIPLDIGEQLIQGYFTEFPGIANGIAKTEKFALANGYTETVYGRRRDESLRLGYTSEYARAAALRELINHPIQGSAAEILKEALILDSDKPQFHTVHDEGLLDVPSSYIYDGHINDVAPFDTPVETKIGINWRDMYPVS
jgi:DNA polymerase-1|tara:strand:+ start:284 stop:1984 length:1701 start_codon:yes stop_codon:yes gene_type:complete